MPASPRSGPRRSRPVLAWAALGGLAGWLELARAVAWYGFVLHLYRRSIHGDRLLGRAFATMGLVAVMVLGVLPLADSAGRSARMSRCGRWARRRGSALAVCNILLIENLYLNTPEPDARWHINLPCIALGGMFLYDLVLYADAVLFHRVSPLLFEGRATATALVGAAAGDRRRRATGAGRSTSTSRAPWCSTARPWSRAASSCSASPPPGRCSAAVGADWGEVAEISLHLRRRARARGAADLRLGAVAAARRCWSTISSATATTIAGNGCAASPRCPRRSSAMSACTTARDPGASPRWWTARRARCSCASREDAAFAWAGSWNMPAAAAPGRRRTHPIVAAFRDGDWIVSPRRRGAGGGAVDGSAELPHAWLAVPLNHLGQLIGFVRARPPARAVQAGPRGVRPAAHRRPPGREPRRRAARHAGADADAQLHEYSKRFAFVVHDIKNVVEPALAAAVQCRDPCATIRISSATCCARSAPPCGKITALIARLQAPERRARACR